VKAAGPTTSIREEPYQADVIKKYGIRSHNRQRRDGSEYLCRAQEFGAVYLNELAGRAVLRPHGEKVLGVELMESDSRSDVAHSREKLRGGS